jgi:Fe-S cluster assembly iron-binding protein IscA
MVLMDPMTEAAAENQTLDYIDNEQGSGFSIQPKLGGC